MKMRQNRRKQPSGGLFARLFCAILFYEVVYKVNDARVSPDGEAFV